MQTDLWVGFVKFPSLNSISIRRTFRSMRRFRRASERPTGKRWLHFIDFSRLVPTQDHFSAAKNRRPDKFAPILRSSGSSSRACFTFAMASSYPAHIGKMDLPYRKFAEALFGSSSIPFLNWRFRFRPIPIADRHAHCQESVALGKLSDRSPRLVMLPPLASGYACSGAMYGYAGMLI